MRANETQVGGTHYKSVYQHWDLCADAFGDAHCKSAFTKYLVRWRSKGGVLDLAKARHYLTKLIELLDDGSVVLSHADANLRHAINVFIIANDLGEKEGLLTASVMLASNVPDLIRARTILDNFIDSAKAEACAEEKTKIPAPPGA